MKTWILQTFFKKELEDTFREASIDAFRKAHADILETHVEEVEERAEELSQEKLANLLSIVDPKLVLTFDSKAKAILVGGERIDQGRLANLHSEAQFFAESELWKIIVESMNELAQRALFKDDGKSEVVHAKGRSMLFLLDTQKKMIDLLKSLSTTQSSS